MTKARDLANAADVLDDVSATELSYVNGVTSAIQTQLNAKQAVVSGVDDTEIGYLNGVTSNIQTQIDSKIGSASAINPTIVDAKGDIIAATAADTVARLAVGSNNTVLTADSSTATGLKWAAVSASPASATAEVTANESTSSSSYTNLATTGPSVTITTGTKALVTVTCFMQQNSSSGGYGYMSFDVTGASSISASDTRAVYNRMVYSSDDGMRASVTTLVTGLTAGSNTFTAKYKSSPSTTSFNNRSIIVVDMGS